MQIIGLKRELQPMPLGGGIQEFHGYHVRPKSCIPVSRPSHFGPALLSMGAGGDTGGHNIQPHLPGVTPSMPPSPPWGPVAPSCRCGLYYTTIPPSILPPPPPSSPVRPRPLFTFSHLFLFVNGVLILDPLFISFRRTPNVCKHFLMHIPAPIPTISPIFPIQQKPGAGFILARVES